MTRTSPLPKRNSKQSLTVAVASDIHAYDGIEPDKAPSHCCVTVGDPLKNPLAGLRDLIVREKLKADLLLCPGDLGDRAQPLAVQHVWTHLHDLKTLLNATDLLATTGNHDVDSRHVYNNFDAKGMLQALKPTYPFSNDSVNDRYWARHFAVVSHGHYRILVLNSSAFHGEGNFDTTKRHEYEQGRVSEYTVQMIRTELTKSKPPLINILLCHHHPHPHSELGLGEDDLMIGGRQLLETLGSGTHGSWIVIHGHKHHPKLEYAAGGSNAPVVFAAGSLAAVLYRELQTVSRNQFYVLEFPHGDFDNFGFVGRFRSWEWASGIGWINAPKASRLPPSGGFGWRGDIPLLAKEVSKVVTKESMRWTDVVSKVPKLAFLLPQDLEQLVRLLGTEHTITVEPADEVPPLLIGRVK